MKAQLALAGSRGNSAYIAAKGAALTLPCKSPRRDKERPLAGICLARPLAFHSLARRTTSGFKKRFAKHVATLSSVEDDAAEGSILMGAVLAFGLILVNAESPFGAV